MTQERSARALLHAPAEDAVTAVVRYGASAKQSPDPRYAVNASQTTHNPSSHTHAIGCHHVGSREFVCGIQARFSSLLIAGDEVGR
jgi:hypothetical protein